MATKIEVLRGETPVEGISVIVGGIAGEELTTNVRGLVTLPALDEGWEGYVDVLIGSGIATATVHIVEGEVHSIDLGDTE
jgi:hypothetical protein